LNASSDYASFQRGRSERCEMNKARCVPYTGKPIDDKLYVR
jgi:hypothetical protein